MGNETSIEWTRSDDGSPGKTWNPVRGCSKVSPGCKFCYAENLAVRFCGPGQPYEGLADRSTGLWTGKVRIVPEHLSDPLRWRTPTRIFVNSMSDLFHEGFSDLDIATMFGVMALACHHTYQILTKRAVRMREWFEWIATEASLAGVGEVELCLNAAAEAGIGLPAWQSRAILKALPPDSPFRGDAHPLWPMPHVWLGVSVEDQQRANERIPELLKCPAAIRFLSVEPMLEFVDLNHAMKERDGIDWVIVGGESGPGARPFDLEWARSIVRQCQSAGVACFVKQLGAKPYERVEVASVREPVKDLLPVMQNAMHNPPPAGWTRITIASTGESFLCRALKLASKKGGDPSEWPTDLRVQQFPSGG